jgi:hypothetical protein
MEGDSSMRITCFLFSHVLILVIYNLGYFLQNIGSAISSDAEYSHCPD